jgi:periplasmic divalent cation tolerance protein
MPFALKTHDLFFSDVVSNKLAACVNIIPGLTSVYEWEGKINTDEEVLVDKTFQVVENEKDTTSEPTSATKLRINFGKKWV